MAPLNSTELLVSLTTLSDRIHKRISARLSAHGISLTDYLVLRQLSQAPSGTLRRIDLADGVGLSASGVTRLLNPMEKIGLVTKQDAPRDARVSLVALTKSGRRIYEEADVTVAESAESLLSPLADDERDALTRIAGMLR